MSKLLLMPDIIIHYQNDWGVAKRQCSTDHAGLPYLPANRILLPSLKFTGDNDVETEQ